MKKILIIMVMGMLLAGCGKVERMVAGYTGWSSICVEGVEYLQFTSGATVAYNTDGSIKKCK